MASAYWQRRNARARERGYKNYYDYRAHGYGATAPAAPRATGARLRQLRGHAGAADLAALIRSGRVELAIVEPGSKDKEGKYTSAKIVLTLDDMSERIFWLRGRALDPERAHPLGQAIRDSGAVLLDAYGLLGPATAAEGPAGKVEDEAEEAA